MISSHCYRIFSLSLTGFSLALISCWQYGGFYYCVQLKKYCTVLIQSLVTSLIFSRYQTHTCFSIVTHLEDAFVISQHHLPLLDFSPIFVPLALISSLQISSFSLFLSKPAFMTFLPFDTTLEYLLLLYNWMRTYHFLRFCWISCMILYRCCTGLFFTKLKLESLFLHLFWLSY